eukprot:COSAG05_NODE_1843_length_3978_cov_2.302913_3_plen_89_part_00
MHAMAAMLLVYRYAACSRAPAHRRFTCIFEQTFSFSSAVCLCYRRIPVDLGLASYSEFCLYDTRNVLDLATSVGRSSRDYDGGTIMVL